MSGAPTLLFLHGVGDGDQDDEWRAALAKSLARLGYPDLDTVEVIAPKYPNSLKGVDGKKPLPPLTVKSPTREAARQNRRNFERRIGAVEFRLGPTDRGRNQPVRNAVVDFAVGAPQFSQAKNYLNDPQIRAHVLTRILEVIPDSGRLFIVGHSLGSVIAADVLRRLPVDVEVTGMVTIGSPLGNTNFDVDKLRDILKDPPTNLAWWVNFWNGPDPVVANRGLSSVFPWLIDFRIQTHAVFGVPAHFAVSYLTDDAVATAIGYGLFGSLSQELATIEKGVDTPLDATETLTLLALRYAHLIKIRLDGERLERYDGALRAVQATAIAELKAQRSATGRPLPSAVARLTYDLSDPEAPVPEPMPVLVRHKDEAVFVLTVLAAQNLVRPFEIAVSRDKRQDALEALTTEMGLGRQFAIDVFAAAKSAQDALEGSRQLNWVGQMSWLKWGAIGAGTAAIVIATGGLALAAAPGVFGAAAITSALAAFGPGGMIGGLLTAGALVTAGGGGIAYGLASLETTAEALEVVVAGQLSMALLRNKQGLDQDPTVWATLVDTEIEVRRRHERLDEFSDEGAVGLKDLQRKIIAIDRALACLRKEGLEPQGGEQAD